MGRLVRDARLETREARRRLLARKEPHWRLIIEGVHLGYYKGNNGGMWYARVRRDKRYYWEALATADDSLDANGNTILNYPQAQERAKKFADKIFKNDDHKETKAYTVKKAVEEYLDDFKANGKKSLYATETQINAHILPTFGEKLVTAITFKQLNAWKNKLATTDKRARSSKKIKRDQKYIANINDDPEYQRRRRATANRVITIFKAILNHAFNTNRAESNEAWQKLRPFKNVSEPKIRFLSEDESVRLINACESDFRLLVRGALLTGTRYGELTTLKIGDYNKNNHTIFIHQSKSGKPRHIPLNKEGVNFFNQLVIGKNLQELIFTRIDGKSWEKNYQVRPLESACSIAKIIPGANFHTLRHTYASALAMKGVPLQVIAAVLGHSDTRVTHKHYAHLMPSYIADVIKEHLPDFGTTEKSNITALKKLTQAKQGFDMDEEILEPRNTKSFIQLLEENASVITDIEKKHGFHKATLFQNIKNLVIFNDQIKTTDEILSTPSKNKNRIIAVSNHTQNLLDSLKRLSKEKMIELNNFLNLFKERNVSFIHSLEDTLRLLRNHLLSNDNRDKYGKYNGNLMLSCLEELLSSLAEAKLQIKIKINNAYPKSSRPEIISINSIKNDLRDLVARCKKIKPKSINEGRAYDAITRNFTIRLMAIYESGTSKQPTITSTGVPTTPYLSLFFDFIEDILPFVKNTLPEGKTVSQIAALACKTFPDYIKLRNGEHVSS